MQKIIIGTSSVEKSIMNFGLKSHQLQFLQQAIRDLLLQQFPTTTVSVFGSRARGDHRSASDIDLLIEPTNEIPTLIISRLRAFFEESPFPFKVDIVLENEIAESYRKQIHLEKINLFPS
jgi:predicted nucleotidyltransferase